jgi:para-aminobenzoate synthetase/4-amino-4-deoxychorismate lyase
LLETMRHDPQRGLRNRDRHLQRLAISAEHLGFRFDLSTARRALDARLSGEPAARVRLRLRRDGTVAVDVEPLPAPSAGPVLLAVDDDPVDPQETWHYHKTSMREPYDRRRERRPDVDDVIMVNTSGELTEVTRATLALQLDGQWWTPPMGSGCLPGVERGRLLEVGRLKERVLHVADLERAEGLAVLNSLRGWRAAELSTVRPEAVPTQNWDRPARTSAEVGSPVPAVLVGGDRSLG